MTAAEGDDAPLAVMRRWFSTMDRALLAPDVAWTVSPGYPVPRRRWTGPADVFDAFFPALRAVFPGWGLTVAAMVPAGEDGVVVRGAYQATPHGAAGPTDIPFMHLWTVRGGRIVAVEAVADFAAAMRPDAEPG